MKKLDNQIHVILQDEQEKLGFIINKVAEVIEANKRLTEIHELQNEVRALQKEEFRSLPWFSKVIKVVSNIKYLFVKHEHQLTTEELERNNNKLLEIDHTLHKIAIKSAPLKETIQQEIRGNLEDLLSRDELSKDQEHKLIILANSYQETSPVRLTQELKNLRSLEQIKNNAVKLLEENHGIQELVGLKRNIQDIKLELPLTFYEKLGNVLKKIRNIFKNTSEQEFLGHKQKGIKKLEHLETSLNQVSSSLHQINDRKSVSLEEELKRLKDRRFAPNQIEEIEASGGFLSETSKTKDSRTVEHNAREDQESKDIASTEGSYFTSHPSGITGFDEVYSKSNQQEELLSSERIIPKMSTFGNASSVATKGAHQKSVDLLTLREELMHSKNIEDDTAREELESIAYSSEVKDVAGILKYRGVVHDTCQNSSDMKDTKYTGEVATQQTTSGGNNNLNQSVDEGTKLAVGGPWSKKITKSSCNKGRGI